VICVLSTPDMCPIWDRAVVLAGLVDRVRSIEIPPDMRHLSDVLDGCTDLVVDLRTGMEIPEYLSLLVSAGAAPDRFVVIGAENLSPKEIFSLVSYDHSFSTPFKVERYGSRSILHLGIYVGEETLDRRVYPDLVPTHGPGVDSEGIVLWDPAPFAGMGTPVSRDDVKVISEAHKASLGDAPLWVKPEFPFLIPSLPQSFTDMNSNVVEGLLCSSPERAGGWVVLTRHDILRLLGHPGDVPWSRISTLIGVEAAAFLLSWVINTSRFPA